MPDFPKKGQEWPIMQLPNSQFPQSILHMLNWVAEPQHPGLYRVKYSMGNGKLKQILIKPYSQTINNPDIHKGIENYPHVQIKFDDNGQLSNCHYSKYTPTTGYGSDEYGKLKSKYGVQKQGIGANEMRILLIAILSNSMSDELSELFRVLSNSLDLD
ncbi:hypothetical protein [Oscillatoria sp. FACHB-1406]|uniref:hypothetical protein n=1 Tax=Oscillatoria sp. FACHB-1406 TaxID=2692846 RepID=UPI0016894087|nr:hypothetical protein [Oscillatoria sp. FACHB-1406]MBD2580083.1 hypothetical protein [Oscillatoria sp. FACHB-1406]